MTPCPRQGRRCRSQSASFGEASHLLLSALSNMVHTYPKIYPTPSGRRPYCVRGRVSTYYHACHGLHHQQNRLRSPTMDAKKVSLGQACTVVLLELRVVPLSLPLAVLHRALEQYAASLRCARTWAAISHVARDRQGEATLWILCSRKEPLRRLDNAFLGWRRALERLIEGSSVERRQWTRVQGSTAVQVYADVHALDDENFEDAKGRLCGIASRGAGGGSALLVSGPLEPLPPQ